MAFADDIADMLANAYAVFGVAAAWSPAGLAPVTCSLLPVLTGDVVAPFGAGARRAVGRRRYKGRVSELAIAGRTPARGDVVVLDPAGAAERLTIVDAPMREDPRQTEWTLELA